MKNILLVLVLSLSCVCFSQEKKETVYLLFDSTNKEKWIVEDGSGNSRKLNKYRKSNAGNYVYYYIGDERFSTHRTKTYKDTCSLRAIEDIKIVSLAYIQKAKAKTILRYNPFEKIYLIEKISKDKIIKIETVWIDDWIMID